MRSFLNIPSFSVFTRNVWILLGGSLVGGEFFPIEECE